MTTNAPNDPENRSTSPAGDENDAMVRTVVARRYRVLELLGRGGMGSVYRAEHLHTKQVVALKVLHKEMTALPEVVKRFEREALAAERIVHPNVARAVDFGQLADGVYYLALEYVEGKSLADVLSAERLPVDRAVAIARQVALALDAAHSAGIVHRDLKPDNILLTRDAAGEDLVKVLDFGIAKVSTGEVGASATPITRLGTVFGTPEYMAPEQAAGQAVDHRADLYTLGLVLYRLLAGRPPFRSEDVSGVLAMQITQPPPPLPQAVDSKLVSIVMRLLEKNPDDRYQNARRVVNVLGAYLGMPSVTNESVPPPRNAAETNTGAELAPSRKESAWTMALLGAGALGALVLVGVWLRHESVEGATDESAPASLVDEKGGSTRPDTRLEEELARAFAGDRSAIAALEQRPVASRSARQWLALGRGYFKTQALDKALHAYGVALSKDRGLANDPQITETVAAATRLPALAPAALRLAAEHLESAGADLLYDVWVRDRDRTPTTELAEQLVKSDAVRRHASPALAAALALREAEACEKLAELIPRVTLHGDRRSLRLLTALERRKDCKIPPATLQAAVSAVRERAAPVF